jgi:hypothetical protein
MKVITRKEAILLGLKRYFTGNLCKRNHLSYRKISNSGCLECHRTSERKNSKSVARKEKHRQHQERYRKNNPEHVRGIVRKSNNKAYKENPGKYKARVAARKAYKIKATPRWTTKCMFLNIEKFYQGCPRGYQVDHIVPLKGNNICGLHVHPNLQYLTTEENASKKNHFVPYYQDSLGHVSPILNKKQVSFKEFQDYLVKFETRS